jgi:hypothetical protein
MVFHPLGFEPITSGEPSHECKLKLLGNDRPGSFDRIFLYTVLCTLAGEFVAPSLLIMSENGINANMKIVQQCLQLRLVLEHGIEASRVITLGY